MPPGLYPGGINQAERGVAKKTLLSLYKQLLKTTIQ